MSWLDDYISRNLSARAEQIEREIKGLLPDEPEEIPDSTLTLAQIASAVMTGKFGVEIERVWWIG